LIEVQWIDGVGAEPVCCSPNMCEPLDYFDSAGGSLQAKIVPQIEQLNSVRLQEQIHQCYAPLPLSGAR
jgi:hypothetical protein